jgi:apoptosis-inducing factor 3
MTEHHIGAASTFLEDGQMKRVEIGETAIIVARVQKDYLAFAANCTHYGAPLEQGVLRGDTLMCPWHHACFHIRNGQRIEPPALSDLASYPVRVEDDAIYVNLDATTKPQTHTEPIEQSYVIVGGGAAGEAAAEELRRLQFNGRVILVSALESLPIDRPNVSKDYLSGDADPAWMPLHDAAWYAEQNIELMLGRRVTGIADAEIIFEDGEKIHFDKLLIATGGRPRTFANLPGGDLANIFPLREQADADRVIAAAQHATNVVIIGASFIGMEAAWALAKRGLSVTAVGLEKIPFERVLGAEIGRWLQGEHERNGVQFRLDSGIERFEGADGRVNAVVLKSGERLPADLVLLGIGIQLNTDFLAESGVNLHEKDRSVLVNEHLRTSLPNVYAAGDIARWHDGITSGTRIEHWRVAQQHGIVAAVNMLGGRDSVAHRVPFFWTHQWEVELRYVGHAEGWDEITCRGSVESGEFIAFYLSRGKLQAAAGHQRDQEMDALHFALRDGLHLTPAQMIDPAFDLVGFAQKATAPQKQKIDKVAEASVESFPASDPPARSTSE